MVSSNQSNGTAIEFRDPAVYAEYEKKWSKLPEDEASWEQRFQEVADVLALDAVQRDQENKSPRAEVALLKHSGLLKILGPKKYGGGEQPWSVAYKAIRKVAEADGCVPKVIFTIMLTMLITKQVNRHASRISFALVHYREYRGHSGASGEVPKTHHRE